MTETQTRARPRIDDPKELDRVVRRLVEAFDPIAIYLFGSRARGDAGKDSDYDLMLVLADENSRMRTRQAVWEAAQSDRIDVNPLFSHAAEPSLGEGTKSARWNMRFRSMVSDCIRPQGRTSESQGLGQSDPRR